MIITRGDSKKGQWPDKVSSLRVVDECKRIGKRTFVFPPPLFSWQQTGLKDNRTFPDKEFNGFSFFSLSIPYNRRQKRYCCLQFAVKRLGHGVSKVESKHEALKQTKSRLMPYTLFYVVRGRVSIPVLRHLLKLGLWPGLGLSE